MRIRQFWKNFLFKNYYWKSRLFLTKVKIEIIWLWYYSETYNYVLSQYHCYVVPNILVFPFLNSFFYIQINYIGKKLFCPMYQLTLCFVKCLFFPIFVFQVCTVNNKVTCIMFSSLNIIFNFLSKLSEFSKTVFIILLNKFMLHITLWFYITVKKFK